MAERQQSKVQTGLATIGLFLLMQSLGVFDVLRVLISKLGGTA